MSGHLSVRSRAGYTGAHPVDADSFSVAIFQFASAAMLGGAAVSAATAASIGLNGSVDSENGYRSFAYSAVLGTGICAVAYSNYSSMSSIRMERVKQCLRASHSDCERIISDDTFSITCLRYSDWLVTMPLLSLKLLEMASDGPKPLDGVLAWQYIPASISAISFVMIACGFVALLAVGDFDTCNSDTRGIATIRLVLYGVGLVCLVAIYIILFATTHATESPHTIEVYGFSLIWVFYPIVFVMQLMGFCGAPKDIAFALLDILSKPLLSVYVAKATLEYKHFS
jgi:bacteriorhodopsin